MHHHALAAFLSLSLFSFSSLVHAIPKFDLTTTGTCSASTVTAVYIETRMVEEIYTITTTLTESHSCYSYTSTTNPHSGVNCGTSTFTPGTCTIAECIQLITKTIAVPCSDKCCATTPTVTVAGPCASCQVGCATSTSLVTTTTGVCSA